MSDPHSFRDVPWLPLDSPRWATLSSVSGAADDVPALLRELMAQKSLSSADHGGPWVRPHDRIYHQGSTYGATYASVPYLVALAEEVGTREREELCLTFGFIAAGFPRYVRSIPDDLAVAFGAALAAAADLTVRLLAEESLSADSAHYLAFGALALVGHRAGSLVDANLSPRSPPEVECTCTSCSVYYLVGLRPDGIARYSDYSSPVPVLADADQPTFRLPSPPPQACSHPSAWADLAHRFENAAAGFADTPPDARECLALAARVCRAGVDAGTDLDVSFIVVAAAAMLHGNVPHGRQLMRLAGPVRCPSCAQTAPLASQMIDFQSSR